MSPTFSLQYELPHMKRSFEKKRKPEKEFQTFPPCDFASKNWWVFDNSFSSLIERSFRLKTVDLEIWYSKFARIRGDNKNLNWKLIKLWITVFSLNFYVVVDMSMFLRKKGLRFLAITNVFVSYTDDKWILGNDCIRASW